ncbi:MAG: (S)-ureidoglycine aminohydrolase [Candidatus Didemnitutus sp.]|nr:(S)-ureidoglycine aminohydrolase [Candidatus Didemnitutus sp.]
MPELFGHTRAHVGPRHALLTPHNHVNSTVPGITGATVVILINEALGARFAQTLVTFQKGGRATFRQPEIQTFGYVLRGEVTVMQAGAKQRCPGGAFFFSPAGQVCDLSGPKDGTQVMFFQKKYAAVPGAPAPRAILSNEAKVKGTPFLGDPAANLQVLLPDEPAFDMAVNIFAYQPGGHLPFVEIHVMEHGLVMLDGQGVYRLEDSWYPVEKGDVVWMGPYCPQWFVAMGKTPARYLYYKDVNRTAL